MRFIEKMEDNLIDFIDEVDIDNIDVLRDDNMIRVRVNPFEKYDDNNFKKKYRFSKAFATKILDLIKEDLPSDTRGSTIEPAIQVACALRYWARHQVSLFIVYPNAIGTFYLTLDSYRHYPS